MLRRERCACKLRKAAENMAPVAGAKQIDRVTGQVIQPRPAVWAIGEPTPFDDLSLRGIGLGITNVLAELGFLFPTVHVATVREKTDGRTRLSVELIDEETQPTLERVEIHGNVKNSRPGRRSLSFDTNFRVVHRRDGADPLAAWRDPDGATKIPITG
jgi:hypothetical protein